MMNKDGKTMMTGALIEMIGDLTAQRNRLVARWPCSLTCASRRCTSCGSMVVEQYHTRRCAVGEWGSSVRPLEAGACDCSPQTQAKKVLGDG